MKSTFKVTIYLLVGIISTLILNSCAKNNDDYDASGSFEAVEVLVSAESSGKITELNIEEGQQLIENQIVGAIDSVQLRLKKQQLIAALNALDSRRPDIPKQLAIFQQQLTTAQKEKIRIQNLVKAEAVNQKQLDDINAQIQVLEKQISAQKSTLESTNTGMNNDIKGLGIQIEQINDQLTKCKIVSPISGTVLAKYAEKGEVIMQGKPLFNIADINRMVLRVYITSDQLTQLKIGQKVKVFTDFGQDNTKEYEGITSWISNKSEFTPKTIATKDERANFVYAVKINVKNDGFLKIGMYGGINLTTKNE